VRSSSVVVVVRFTAGATVDGSGGISAAQLPAASQKLEGPQTTPIGPGVWMTPVAGSQESIVQGFASSTPTSEPLQTPAEHESPEVHVLPSLQGTALSECAHPVSGAHESSVHTLPSSQFTGVVVHIPPPQMSTVQGSLSVQGAVLLI
jgi:hypothetical protein